MGNVRSQKLLYLEGLRGAAAFIVVLAHYACAFYPASVFGIKYPSHSSYDLLFSSTPLGILLAGYAAVCLFFILSGFVLTVKFFQFEIEDSEIHSSIVKRYFRLGLPVLVSIVVSFVLLKLGLFYNNEVALITQSGWFGENWNFNPSFLGFIRTCLISLFSGSINYNPPLWTIQTELYGSYLVFLIVLLFRRTWIRYPVYLIAFVFLRGSLYQGFITGLVFADILFHWPNCFAILRNGVFTCVFIIVGVFLSSYPLYANVEGTIYSKLPMCPDHIGGGYPMIGAFLIFFAVLNGNIVKNILASSVFQFLGKISFSLYLIHMIVLGSFSSILFLFLSRYLPYHQAVWLNVAISIPFILVVSFGMYKFVDKSSVRISNLISNFYQKTTSSTVLR